MARVQVLEDYDLKYNFGAFLYWYKYQTTSSEALARFGLMKHARQAELEESKERGTVERKKNIRPQKITEAQIVELNRLYHEENKNIKEIQKILRMGSTTVCKYLKNPRPAGKQPKKQKRGRKAKSQVA